MSLAGYYNSLITLAASQRPAYPIPKPDNPLSSVQLAQDAFRTGFYLNPVTFSLGLTQHQYQSLLAGSDEDDGFGWTLEILRKVLKVKTGTRVELLRKCHQLWQRRLARLARLVEQPTPDEIEFEYGYDPRRVETLIYFYNPAGEVSAISIDGDRNPALNSKLGTRMRIVPRVVMHKWLRLEWYYELLNYNLDPMYYQQLIQILDPLLIAVADQKIVAGRLIQHLESSLNLSSQHDLSAYPPLLLGNRLNPETKFVVPDGVSFEIQYPQVFNPILEERFSVMMQRLLALDHPYLEKITGYTISPDYSLVFITREGASVHPLKPEEVKAASRPRLARQLAEVVAYLHGQGMVINYIDPDNVLIDEKGDLKLRYYNRNYFGNVPFRLTRRMPYRAPEVYQSLNETYMADIFSLGFMLFYILTGTEAFSGRQQGWIFSQIRKAVRPNFPEDIPVRVKAVIEASWNNDFTQRPSADDILEILT